MHALDDSPGIRCWSALVVVIGVGAASSGGCPSTRPPARGPTTGWSRNVPARSCSRPWRTPGSASLVGLEAPTPPPTPEPAHGHEPRLLVHAWDSPPGATAAYVRFDLKDVPLDVPVLTATFRLWLVEDAGAFPAMYAHRVVQSWDEESRIRSPGRCPTSRRPAPCATRGPNGTLPRSSASGSPAPTTTDSRSPGPAGSATIRAGSAAASQSIRRSSSWRWRGRPIRRPRRRRQRTNRPSRRRRSRRPPRRRHPLRRRCHCRGR